MGLELSLVHTICCHSMSRPLEVTEAVKQMLVCAAQTPSVSFLSCLCHLLCLAAPSVIPRHFESCPFYPPSTFMTAKLVLSVEACALCLRLHHRVSCAVHTGRQMVGGQEDKPICSAFPLLFLSLKRFAVITNTLERTPRSLEL